MANIEQGGQAVRNGVQRLKEGARTGAQRAREKVVNVAERGHEYLHRRRGDRPVKFIRTSPGVEVSTPRTLADVADGIGQQVPVIDVSSRHDTNGFVASNGAVPAPEHSRAVAVADHEEPDDPNERPISLRPRPEPAIATNGATPDSHRNGSSHNGTGVITGESAHTNGHHATEGTGFPSVQRNGTALDSSASIPPASSHVEPVRNGDGASPDEEAVQPHRNGTSPDGSAPVPLVDSHSEPAVDTVSEEQRQQEANRRHLMGVNAYREITGNEVGVTADSNRDDIRNQLRAKGHNWQEDELTDEYIDAAIDRAKVPQEEWAAQELQAKGIKIDETDTAESLFDKVKEKDPSWEKNPATIDYLEQAAPQKVQQEDPNDKPDNRDQNPPTIEKKDHREGQDIARRQVSERAALAVERERVGSADVRYLEPELSDDNGYSMYLGPQAMEKWGVHEGERVRAVNDRGQEYFVEVHGAVKRDTGEIEDMDSPFIRMSARAIDHLGFRGEPVIPEIGTVGDEGQKELKLKSAEVVKDVVNTPELRGIHIQEVEIGASSELALTPQMLEMWGVKPGDVITIRHGKVSIPGVTIAESAATDGEDKAPSWDMKLQKEEGEKLKALEGFSLRSKFNKDSKELSVGPSIAFVTAMNIERTGDSEFARVAEMAKEYGVMAYVVSADLNKQGPDFEELKKDGMMWAYVYKDGEYKKVKAPIADVLYEKDSNTDSNEFWQTNFEHTVFPMDVQINTHYKQEYAEKVLDATPALKGFYPDTMAIPERATSDEQRESIQNFLTSHNEVILKPNNGQNGRGMITVTRGEDGTYTFSHGSDEPQTLGSVDDILASVEEVKTRIKLGKSPIGEDYVMQEKLKLPRVTYKDPVTGEELTGIPEPRILTQRGPDGKVRVVGQLVKMQEPRRADGRRLTNGRGSVVDFHVTDLGDTLRTMYGDDADRIQQTMNDVSVIQYDAVEKASGGAQAGELPMDYLLPEGKPPQILEINYKGNVGTLVEYNSNLKDARYYAAAGPLQHTLAVTGYN